MTAEHAHGIDTGGEVEALLFAHQMRSTLTDACTCGAGDMDTLQPTGIAIRRHRRHLALVLGQTAADTVLAEARRLCCGENPAAHHAASAKHSELMAFAGDLARAVRGL